MDFLEKIEFDYKISDDQSDLFTDDHTRFICTISYAGISKCFDYQCNKYNTEPTLENVLACLLYDYEFCDDEYGYDCADFLEMYGHLEDASAESIRKGMASYQKCRENGLKLNTLFNYKEIKQLHERMC